MSEQETGAPPPPFEAEPQEEEPTDARVEAVLTALEAARRALEALPDGPSKAYAGAHLDSVAVYADRAVKDAG